MFQPLTNLILASGKAIFRSKGKSTRHKYMGEDKI